MMWCVLVEWANSVPTVHGPFASGSDAESWGAVNARPNEGVTTWQTLALGSPAFDATGWKLDRRKWGEH